MEGGQEGQELDRDESDEDEVRQVARQGRRQEAGAGSCAGGMGAFRSRGSGSLPGAGTSSCAVREFGERAIGQRLGVVRPDKGQRLLNENAAHLQETDWTHSRFVSVHALGG
ncbi:hypothetical protein NF552_04100 [Roseomonas mucosa]|nr:hypothetical protein NF552_04100 [Roseomonas mucosa]